MSPPGSTTPSWVSSSTGGRTRCRAGRRGFPTSRSSSSATARSACCGRTPTPSGTSTRCRSRAALPSGTTPRCTGRAIPTRTSPGPSTKPPQGRTSRPWPSCAATPAPATSSSPPSTTTGSPCGPPGRPTRSRAPTTPTRDLVGDLAVAVREHRMRMGLYYSGGYDWPYNGAVLTKAADAVLAVPFGREYVRYVTAHVRELIDRYEPSVLWNDIGWPKDKALPELFAHYYNTVEEGVINDRWRQNGLPRNVVTDALVRGVGAVVSRHVGSHPRRPQAAHFRPDDALRLPDARVRGPARRHRPRSGRWRAASGTPSAPIATSSPRTSSRSGTSSRCSATSCRRTATCSSASGPGPTAPCPRSSRHPCRALGAWLADNGEAIYGSRPWVVTESTTTEGTPLRFTKSGEGVYALVMGMPASRRVTLRGIDGTHVRRVRLVGAPAELAWTRAARRRSQRDPARAAPARRR